MDCPLYTKSKTLEDHRICQQQVSGSVVQEIEWGARVVLYTELKPSRARPESAVIKPDSPTSNLNHLDEDLSRGRRAFPITNDKRILHSRKICVSS